MRVRLMRPSTEALLPVTVPLHRKRGPTVLCLLCQPDSKVQFVRQDGEKESIQALSKVQTNFLTS